MKFDNLVKQMLSEGVHLGNPPEAKKIRTPDDAQPFVVDAFRQLMNYDYGQYQDFSEFQKISENTKLGKLMNLIRYVFEQFPRDTYMVGTEQYSKADIIRDILLKTVHLGVKDKKWSAKTLDRDGDDPVTVRHYNVGDLAYFPVDALSQSVNDVNGNAIDRNERLSGADYRLSIILDTEQIKLYGGVEIFHQLYKSFFPMVGLRLQPYRRTSEDREEGDERNIIIYWWGENYLPYRTALKVNNEGKIVKVGRIIDRELRNDVGAAFWRTDQQFKQRKARPLSLIGPQGAYDGNIVKDKTPEELSEIMESNNFDSVIEETQNLSDLDEPTLEQLYQKQQNYVGLSPEEKMNVYKQQFEEYKKAWQARGTSRRPLRFQVGEVGFPYFNNIQENDGEYIPVLLTAEDKFKWLYPENEFPDLYTER